MNRKKNHLLLILLILPLVLVGQKSDHHNVSSNSVIKKWLVAGPFPNPLSDENSEGESWMKGFSHDFLKNIGGEENAILKKVK